MIKLPRAMRGALWMALAFLGLQTFQAVLLKSAFEQEEHGMADRLAAGVSGALNQAHRTGDDLYMVRVVEALERSPGIVSARIIRQGVETWGHLVLVVSDHFSQALVQRQWLVGTAASALVWIILYIYLQHLEKRAVDLRVQVLELNEMLRVEQLKRGDFEKRERQASLQSSAWLQEALRRISYSLLLLDAHQRVVAANAKAAAMLGVSGPMELAGKSWHEIKGLDACGPFLTESLESPGRPVHKMDGPAGRPVEFLTILSPENRPAGTWVRMHSPDFLIN